MEKNKKLGLILGIILFISFIYALQISNFDGYGTSENITFSGNENYTRNITIYKDANVTSAFMNLSGFNYLCYQETANISTICGGLDNGSYGFTTNYFQINYTKPNGASNLSLWTVKHGIESSSPYNITLPLYCWNASVDKLMLRMYSESSTGYQNSNAECWNGTAWDILNTTNSTSANIVVSSGVSNLIDGDWDTAARYSNQWGSVGGWDAASRIFEEAMWWNMSSHPTNPYIQINNTQIWSVAGNFVTIKNKTDDFSSILNTALNDGACDCVGCVLTGDNCSIETIFHSDTAGILEYSALNITYTNPSITLISPIDSHTYGTNESLELNFTYINFTEVDCFYNIQNTTSYITSNISTDCLNTTFNVSQGEGTFNLSIYMNNSNGIMAQDSNTFSIVLDSPAINLDYPDNNSFFNSETVYFNFTATDTDGVDTCILYGDFNGTWLANETFNGIVSGTQNYTILNLQEKENLWTIWCNDSLGNEGFALENKTFTIDLTDPTMNNMTITTTTGSQTIQFLTNITDTNLDRCEYSVYNLAGGIDGSSVNVSFTCNTLSSATVSGFASYYLNVTAYDSANNSNKQGLLFTTSATSGGGTTTGGGGGTTIVTGQSDWIMTTSGDGTSYEKVMPTGTSDKLNLYFENFGEDEKDITLSCVNQEGTMCQYVSYDESTFKLPVLKEIKTQKDFTLTIPEGVDEGDYSFNIIATDEDSVQRSVTVYLSLGTKGIFQSTISKLGLSTEKGFPYIFIFLPFLLVSLVGSVIIIPEKFPTKGIWVVILTLFIPFFAIYMI